MIHSPRKPSPKQYLLQLGAFIIHKKLNRVRDEVSTLGYFTHIKEINRKLDSYCPIVGENLNEDETKALILKLNSEGSGPVPLKDKKGRCYF